MTETFSIEFAKALVAVQGEIEGAKKGSTNPAFRSKYADLGACWDACRDALQKNNIVLLQPPTQAEHGYVGLRTVLVYGPTGETFTSFYKVPLKDPTNPQALGSAITYARRYALCSIIGICPVDDDGAAASKAVSGPKFPKEPTTNQASAVINASVFKGRFDALTSVVDRKSLYTEVKNSSLPEPSKTALLSEWSTVIKAQMALEASK